MNAADNKAIFSIPLYRSRVHRGQVVHQGNYDDGSSKGMEGYALDIAIQRLQSSGLAALITGWVGDQDSSVLKQLRECPAAQKWEVHLDPGHAKKNLVNALAAVFGEKKEFEGLAMRIPTFIMRCTKRAEKEHAQNVAGMRTQFMQWLDCVVPHYTQACGADCPHHQQDDLEPRNSPPSSASTPTSTSCKTYLHQDIHGSQIAQLESIIIRMKQSARYFIHGYNTCNTERYHRERLKFTPKQIEFRKTWAPRCALNQLIHNVGYAVTHRLVLAKLSVLQHDIPFAEWAKGMCPGNPYIAAMDSQRTYHSTRKSRPEYNRREDQLAREFGKRRATHDRTSKGRGHDYQHSPPLYNAEHDGEAALPQQKKPRRTKEQIDKDEKEQQEKEDRLRALFDGGDTTFSTLGVIDVNVLLKKKGRTGKKREGGQTEGGGDEETGEVGRRQGSRRRSVGKENSTPSHPPALRKRASAPRHQQPTSVVAMDVEMALTAAGQLTALEDDSSESDRVPIDVQCDIPLNSSVAQPDS